MTHRPLIGITVNYIGPEEPTCPSRSGSYYLNRTYVEAISSVGGVPVPLVYFEKDLDVDAVLARLDGVLLTGGKDMDPSWFGEPPHPKAERIIPARTRSEILLTRRAVHRDLPLFGICLGHQTLNVALGGDLYQDIPSQQPSDIDHRGTEATRNDLAHPVTIEPGTRLHRILGVETLDVNSVHHQACRRIGEGLRVSSWAPDGVVEGLEIPEARFCISVQWHPEDLVRLPAHRALFEAFMEATSRATPVQSLPAGLTNLRSSSG